MKNQNNNKVNTSDRILSATILKLFPKRVTPNQITIFRFFTVPFIILLLWLGKYELGAILFVISAFTDALDGALARTTNRVTMWGSTYDPLADKLLIGMTAFVILPRFIGPWIAFAIILLEMFLIGMAYYNSIHGNKKLIKANWWGKSKMICQSAGVFLVLIYILWPVVILLAIAEIILYISIVLAVLSLVTYSL